MKETLADTGLLWLRALVGLGLIVHGWMKLAGGIEKFISSVDAIGFPYPVIFAWLGVATEVLGGLFLMLGLWTRWVAVPVIFMMGVAAFSPLSPAKFIGSPPSKELALAYLTMAVAVLLLGPGRFAVDGRVRATGAKKSKR